jgi:MoxR-like ATPase
MEYLMQIVTATRRDDRIRLGASTRGAQFLLKAAKAHAYYEGRDYIVPDDIRRMAPLVLGHRLILKTRKFISDAEQVVHDILGNISVPV